MVAIQVALSYGIDIYILISSENEKAFLLQRYPNLKGEKEEFLYFSPNPNANVPFNLIEDQHQSGEMSMFAHIHVAAFILTFRPIAIGLPFD